MSDPSASEVSVFVNDRVGIQKLQIAISHFHFFFFLLELSPVFFDSAHSLQRTFFFFNVRQIRTRQEQIVALLAEAELFSFFLFALLTLLHCRPSGAPAVDKVHADTYLTQV